MLFHSTRRVTVAFEWSTSFYRRAVDRQRLVQIDSASSSGRRARRSVGIIRRSPSFLGNIGFDARRRTLDFFHNVSFLVSLDNEVLKVMLT